MTGANEGFLGIDAQSECGWERGELRAELSFFNDPAKSCWTWRCGQLNRNGWWWQNHRERKGLESVAKAEAAESACKKCIGRAGEVGQLAAGCEGESGEGGPGKIENNKWDFAGSGIDASTTERERRAGWVEREREPREREVDGGGG